MKICPSCRKTYADDGLNFCLDDGSVLTLAGNMPPETLLMNQPRPTAPSPFVGNQPGVQPQYSMQPKKSSKTWVWVLGILTLLILLCGGGFAGLFLYIASQTDVSSDDRVYPTPTRTSASPKKSATPPTGATPSPSPFESADVQEINLADWVNESSSSGTTEFTDGELVMGSLRKDFYYVLAAPAEYQTEMATTRVTVRNADEANSSLGYGLVFHSDPMPLRKDYAFLIDSIKKKYRVVRHGPQSEIAVVGWTSSAFIKDGSQENILEVRDKPDKIELYINGQMVDSIKNTHGYKGGVVGLYSGDGVKIGFKDLEISKIGLGTGNN